MWGAVMGLVLLLCSWLILYTINPQLTKLSEPALKKIELTGHTGYTILSPDIPQAYSQVQGSYGDMVSKYSQENGVPSNIVNGVIMAESKGDPNAVGPPTKYGTAKGLMQLLDGTAKDMGVTDVFNPEQNIKGGTRYLGQLYNYYGGNMDNALAAYNWGPGNMDKYLAGQKSMPAETQKYIANVYNYSRQGAPQSPVM
ncbi:MAG: lytic transglycosylase domain-containing protein [Candidatus Portnoybacteria bacterium]|nr:lytic transglycosylase domain-containing protein [Candidatus Portnoybacteria bacterium]